MEQLWLNTLEYIQKDFNDKRFDKWVNAINNIKLCNNTVYMIVNNNYAQQYIYNEFGSLIKSKLRDVSNKDLDLAIITQEEAEEIDFEEKNEIENQTTTNSILPCFNSRYTFDTFVVGSSNRFAHAAALTVAEQPATAYNPLFIYGGSGLGKTHLMHAIAHAILKKKPTAKIIYVSTETFTNEFISSIRSGNYNFKNKYRNADVFLIDDIQFLSGKRETQEEFFHTFNALHEAGKQIVISSDRPPTEISTLEERLRSRFKGGLITDIQPPNIETRIAILQRKALQDNILINDEVIFYIADKINSNIRELEGALNRVVLYSNINNITNIDVNHAIDALKAILPANERVPLTIGYIQKNVADYYKVKIDDLKSKKRDKSVTFPRQIAMYLCREILDVSLPKIGQEFGGRDHSTVIHSCEKINKERKIDATLDSDLNQLNKNIMS